MDEEATLTLDGIDYKIDDLTVEGKDLVESLKFTEIELNRAKAFVAVLETAKAGYIGSLKNHLPMPKKNNTAN